MAITNFMNIDLPTVSVTLGPEWATQVNAAFATVDAHDHSSDKGVKVKPAGLDMNDHLNMQVHKIYGLFSTQYQENNVPLTGASNAQSVSVSGGDLYYTNDSGVAIQITSGGSIISVPASANSFERTSIASSTTISPSDTYVVLEVDTTSSRTITLPLASSVAGGRIYIIKDVSGMSRTNILTIARQGSDLIDGQSSIILNSNYGSVMVVGDGGSNYSIL
jgi:hypothetical protein